MNDPKVTEQVELLPCPFCGSSNIRAAQPGTEYSECRDCGVYGPSPERDIPLNFIASSAIEIWNRRTPDAAREARVAELTQALRELIRVNEQHNEQVELVIGRQLNWKDSYLDRARAAIANTQE